MRKIFAAVVLILVVLVVYGLATQCDDVAVYVKCRNFWG